MDTYSYYSTLLKPFFAPHAWIFGIVWTILYVIIAVTFSYVVFQILEKKYPSRLLIPLILNVVSNILYTPMQFGLKNNLLATIDIFIVLGSLIWLIFSVKKYSRPIAFAQIPYLIWVSFATILQISITYLNW